MSEAESTPEQPTKRHLVQVLVKRNGEYLISPMKGDSIPASRILIPMIDPNDTRLFVRNGELISPHSIYVFELGSIEGRPELGHDEVRYHEVERHDFDPTDCVPIMYFDIAKYADELNAASSV